jgi:transposase
MTAEIISTVERRRRWSTEDKVRIMSEALERGVSIASVADRNGVCRSLLYTWLRLAREDRLSGISRNRASAATFVPVRIAPSKRAEPAAAVAPPAPPSTEARSSTPPPLQRSAALVEIALGNGRVIKVDASIDPVALARLVAALDGGRS